MPCQYVPVYAYGRCSSAHLSSATPRNAQIGASAGIDSAAPIVAMSSAYASVSASTSPPNSPSVCSSVATAPGGRVTSSDSTGTIAGALALPTRIGVPAHPNPSSQSAPVCQSRFESSAKTAAAQPSRRPAARHFSRMYAPKSGINVFPCGVSSWASNAAALMP